MLKGLMKNFSGTQTAVWLVLPFNIIVIGALFYLATFTKTEVQEYFIKVFTSWLTISTPTVLTLYGYKRHQERKYDKKENQNLESGAKGTDNRGGSDSDNKKQVSTPPTADTPIKRTGPEA